MYKIYPNDLFATVHFSGGRTSGYLLWHILEANNGLPDNVNVVFANTGKEKEETLEFIEEFSQRTGCPITWIEYRYWPKAKGYTDPKHGSVVVDFKTASRNSEPFEMLLECDSFLPSVTTRTCTTSLKIWAHYWYMRRNLKIKKWRDLIGFRYDEPKRYNRALNQARKNKKHKRGRCPADIKNYPLVLNQVTKEDVWNFWKSMPFDLKLDPSQTNCDLCFQKPRHLLVELMKKDPESAKWWIEAEEKYGRKKTKTKGRRQFRSDYSYKELSIIASEGGQVPVEIDDGLPCFCFD